MFTQYLTFIRSTLFFLSVLCTVCICSSCSDDPETRETPVNRIVLAYFGGDNNLSGDGAAKITALCQGWNSTVEGRLFVFFDSAYDTPELFEIVVSETGNTVRRTIRQFQEELNSADPEVLRGIIDQVVTDYPADSYGLIVFSHASGWLPSATLTAPKTIEKRSILTDKSREMEFLDFAAAIPENTFDFILFEACFMAGIEVAYELKDKTAYILASSAEIVSPGFEEIYKTSLSVLFTKTPDLAGFARNAFDYYNGLTGSSRSATFSLIRTSELERLGNWITQHCKTDASLETDLKEIQKFNRSSYPLFLDFEDYFSRQTDESLLEEFREMLDKCILYKAATPRFEISPSFTIRTHSGLTTYALQAQYPFLNEEYQKLRWYKEVIGINP